MTLTIEDHPFDFFLREFSRAVSAEHVPASPQAQIYLAGVLHKNMTTVAWHPGRALGLQAIQALKESAGSTRQLDMMRELGDAAWVISGLYPTYHDMPRMGYYMGLGHAAYGRLGGELFTELASNFRRLVDALMRFSADHSLVSERDIMRLYELWRDSRSRHIARILSQQGIILPGCETDGPPS